MTNIRFCLILSVILVLMACGRKGALYIPEPETQAQDVSAQQADVNTEPDKKSKSKKDESL